MRKNKVARVARVVGGAALLMLGALFSACVASPVDSNQEQVASTLSMIRAADYLAVEQDGTLSIKHDALTRMSPGERHDALASLDEVNHQIERGELARFLPNDERLLTERPDPSAAASSVCFCADHCCGGSMMHMCCQSGWWIFCWGYKSC